MSRWSIPRHERLELQAKDLARVVAIVNNTPEREPPADRTAKRTRNLEGDARVMRMIPICAEGVPGTEPGTHPLNAYLEKERRHQRRNIA